MAITIPVSAGELVDRITILRIKAARLSDPDRLAHVERELATLEAILSETLETDDPLIGLTADLTEVNREVWEAVEALERLERQKDFAEPFVQLARNVLRLNDLRFALKSAISDRCDSEIREQKSAVVRSAGGAP